MREFVAYCFIAIIASLLVTIAMQNIILWEKMDQIHVKIRALSTCQMDL